MRTCARSRHRVLTVIGLLVVSVTSLGCQPEAPARQAISGTVSIPDSESNSGLPNGTLMLLPTEGHSGPAASTTVVDGAFEFATSNGPLPGTYSAVFTVKLENDEASETVFPMSKAELLAGRTDDETSEKLNSQTPTKFRTRVEISEDQSDAVQLEFEK